MSWLITDLSSPISISIPYSLEFNGTDERMISSAVFDVGNANQWTIMGWIKTDVAALSDVANFLYWQFPSAGSNNSIQIAVVDPFAEQTKGGLSILTAKSNGSAFKELSWYDRLTDDTWAQYVYTYDGASGGDPLVLYLDGASAGAPDAATKDGIGTMDNTDTRDIQLGGVTLHSPNYGFPGLVHQTAMWSVPLTASEILAIYNGGSAGFDLTANSGNYSSSSNLLHWWQLGANASNWGEDTGSHSTLKDLTATNMDASNRIEEGPI